MKLQLCDGWVLTNVHNMSSYGQPILVNTRTKQAYGSCDLLKVNHRGRFFPAYTVARMLTEGKKYNEDELEFLDRFIL